MFGHSNRDFRGKRELERENLRNRMYLFLGTLVSNMRVILRNLILKDVKSTTKSIQLFTNDIIMFLNKENSKNCYLNIMT
jgi:hypothetical protein